MTEESDPAAEPDAVFMMEPVATLMTLARFFVDGQRALADHGRAVERAAPMSSTLPEIADFAAKYRALQDSWHQQTLPTLAASMALALEVYDTFGPGRTVIEDRTDAAIWNNKHHVWTREMTPPAAGTT
jgi:hypothetical protein